MDSQWALEVMHKAPYVTVSFEQAQIYSELCIETKETGRTTHCKENSHTRKPTCPLTNRQCAISGALVCH